MAIVQISRIQVRRGQKNAGTGIPQLAGGEFGWAVDTRELYIGNGSVSEGAPAVGNTKVITQHDNLFTFADTYKYKSGDDTIQTGATTTTPVTRTLQARLDENVNVLAFDATADGTDQTLKLQRAIDQLYLNSASKGSVASRIRLHFPAGNYLITNSLKVPPHATLVGEGSERTVITQSGAFPILETVNSTSTPGVYASDATSSYNNQAQDIQVTGFSLVQQTANEGIKLVSCRDSSFTDIKIKGTWTAGGAAVSTQAGILLNSLSTAVSSNSNTFKDVTVDGHTYGVFSDFDIKENLFDNITFNTLDRGVAFGQGTNIGSQGQLTGPVQNSITNSKFSNIDEYGIFVNKGNFNRSSHNTFTSVGNNGGSNANASFAVIKFTDGTALTNSSTGDFFDRTADLTYNQTLISGYAYVPEVEGPGVFKNDFSYRIPIQQQNTFVRVLKCSGDVSKNVQIAYVYKSTAVNAIREGVLNIFVNLTDGTTQTTDDFTFLGTDSYRPNLEFQTALADEDGNGTSETIVVQMKNTTTSDTGSISFNVSYKT